MPTFAFAPIEELVTREYRLPLDVHETLNATLSLFKGTHNYHNFTSRKYTLTQLKFSASIILKYTFCDSTF